MASAALSIVVVPQGDAPSDVRAAAVFAIPLVSTTLGVAVLGETLTRNEPVGAVLVLVGAWLTRPRAPRGAPTPTPRQQVTRPG